MDRVLERWAGLDVHKKTVTACVRVPGISGDRVQHVRSFGTTTGELLTLSDRAWYAVNGMMGTSRPTVPVVVGDHRPIGDPTVDDVSSSSPRCSRPSSICGRVTG